VATVGGKDMLVRRERLHLLTMPYPSQTYRVIRRSSWKDEREHASAAQSMAGETLQGTLQIQFIAVIAVVSTCVGVVASCSITQKTHQY